MTCLLTATHRQYDPDILFWLEIVEAPDEPKIKENHEIPKGRNSSRGPTTQPQPRIPQFATPESFLAL